jgi:hypothetical protein
MDFISFPPLLIFQTRGNFIEKLRPHQGESIWNFSSPTRGNLVKILRISRGVYFLFFPPNKGKTVKKSRLSRGVPQNSLIFEENRGLFDIFIKSNQSPPPKKCAKISQLASHYF